MTIDESFEFTDRYQGLGIPYPDISTVCRGQCEGTGVFPTQRDDPDPRVIKAWDEAHAQTCGFWNRLRTLCCVNLMWRYHVGPITHVRTVLTGCDGYHFIRCPDCNGTGKRT